MKRVQRRAVLAGGLAWSLATFCPAVRAAEPDTRAWAVRLPSIDKVVFRGIASMDEAGVNQGQFLYPAPNALGLLAGILTHGLLTEGAKRAQKDKLQAEADTVLVPYQATLDGFTHERLLTAALPALRTAGPRRLLAANEGPGGEHWLVEVAPIYSITRDQRAIVLDNVVRMFAPVTDTPARTVAIRVVSAPLVVPPDAAASAPEAAWLAQDGRALLDTSVALFAESLDIAMGSVAEPGEAAPQRTIRYRQGDAERMERGHLLEDRCGRVLIRTLRGGLMSVPSATPAGPGCGVAR